MGGGALLDVGIYCIAPLLAAAGRLPARVEAAASMTKSGVDASFAGWLDWGDGFTAAIECSFDAPERQLLEIVGTEASVLVDRAYTPGRDDRTFTLRHRSGRLAPARQPDAGLVEQLGQVPAVDGAAVRAGDGPGLLRGSVRSSSAVRRGF